MTRHDKNGFPTQYIYSACMLKIHRLIAYVRGKIHTNRDMQYESNNPFNFTHCGKNIQTSSNIVWIPVGWICMEIILLVESRTPTGFLIASPRYVSPR